MHEWPDFLDQDAPTVARKLLGCYLIRKIDGVAVRVRIVETEAYRQDDAASHSYKGETARTEVMFGENGRLYVYFTYGMHYCCNVVAGAVGYGAGVLIRAVEPLGDVAPLVARRYGRSGPDLTNGPAKLCQALGIDMNLSGHDLRAGELRLVTGDRVDESDIVTTNRVGITKAIDIPWRFYLRNNPFVSKQ